MKTEAQVKRDARKRAKARAKKRGIAPHTTEVSLTTYIWDGWHDLCLEHLDEDRGFTKLCRNVNDPTYHVFWNGTCIDNMLQHHFRSINSGWLVNSGHEVSSHIRDYLEAHGESVRHHKAYLQNREGGCKLSFGWDSQHQRKFTIEQDAEGVRELLIRTELVVRKPDGKVLGGHIWQGIGEAGIGVADVVAAMEDLL